MESNTVIIGTEEYYRLREFKDKILESEVVAITEDPFFTKRMHYITKDNAIGVLGQELKEMKEQRDARWSELRAINKINLQVSDSFLKLQNAKRRKTAVHLIGMVVIYLLGFATAAIALSY